MAQDYYNTLVQQISGNAKISLDLKDDILDVVKNNFSENDAKRVAMRGNGQKGRFGYDATTDELSAAVEESLSPSQKNAYQRQSNKYARAGIENPNSFIQKEFSPTYYDAKNRHYFKEGRRVSKMEYFK